LRYINVLVIIIIIITASYLIVRLVVNSDARAMLKGNF